MAHGLVRSLLSPWRRRMPNNPKGDTTMNAIRMLILALTLCIGFCLATQAHAFDLFRFLDADDAQTMGNPLAISNEPTYLGGVRKSVPAAPTLR